ncbi:hypothetical protein LOZ66_003918 [Ophidiomyces ophidiicola]|nr:hypothetical protein LOZ65_004388 [Ophidiomyces ophidiicola]KAI1937638.1 hypothetical protein LOZ66_003918 [Ophidiomyces ophidiicola]
MDSGRQNNVEPDVEAHDMKPILGRIKETKDDGPGPEVSIAHIEGDYKVYKRRFFGLGQLVLLNIVVSWDWLTFSAVSKTSAQYFNVSESAINWLSTGFLFAFCVTSPIVIWTLNKGGPKPSIVACAALLLVGNWVRYAGTKANNGMFGLTMFGQIIIGFAQPFVLTAPTRYSDAWFSDRGRTSATAVATLANPLGGALGQLIGPMWATKPSEVPNMVLYVSIVSSIACIPSFFIPSLPPTPPNPAVGVTRIPLRESLIKLMYALEFWLVFFPFSIYIGIFNSISSLLNQILQPHGFSEIQAGITGALLIFVGLVAAAICSPIIDKYKHYLGTIRVLIPIIALSYLGFVFAPESPSVAGPYVVASILGASSFAILPVILEYLVEITYPISPEIPSTLCWVGGQIFGAAFVLIETALKASPNAKPPLNMKRALIFQAVMAAIVVPTPFIFGQVSRRVGKRRLEAEQQAKARRNADRGVTCTATGDHNTGNF